MAGLDGQLAGFSADYLLDLATRFINWQMVAALSCCWCRRPGEAAV